MAFTMPGSPSPSRAHPGLRLRSAKLFFDHIFRFPGISGTTLGACRSPPPPELKKEAWPVPTPPPLHCTSKQPNTDRFPGVTVSGDINPWVSCLPPPPLGVCVNCQNYIPRNFSVFPPRQDISVRSPLSSPQLLHRKRHRGAPSHIPKTRKLVSRSPILGRSSLALFSLFFMPPC